MSEPTPTSAAEIELVRDAYAALNRGDVAGFVRMFDPQIERAELFSGVHHRGLEAVTEHVSTGRATWAEGSCQPERFLVSGNRVVVLVHVRVRVKTEIQWREGRLADVYTFRDGRAIEFRTFADRRQALEWAGLDPASAGCAEPSGPPPDRSGEP